MVIQGSMDKRLLWFFLGLSLLFTLFVIQWSFRQGRLSMDPLYDDVGYLLDGRNRLDVFDRKGPIGLAISLWHNPPHSPWSTLLALGGFVILGVQAWVPYAANGVLVMAFLLAANRLFGGKSFWLRCIVALVVLALPMTFLAACEFRPDFAVALVTAYACFFTIRLEQAGANDRRVRMNRFLAGALFGLAYLIKPSFLYHTTAMLVVSFVLSEILRMIPSVRPREAGQVQLVGLLGRAASFVAGSIVIAGAYYLKAWKEVINYIVMHTGSGTYAKIFMTSGGVVRTFKEYVVSGDMAQMLGPFLWLLLATVIVGLIFNYLQKEWRNLTLVLAGLTCSAASLAIMCVGQVENSFFGLTWQILLVFSTISVLGTSSQNGLLPCVVVGFALGFAWLKTLQPPVPKLWHLETDALVSRSLNKEVIKRCEQLIPVTSDRGKEKIPVIFVAFSGAIDSETQTWLADDEKYRAQFLNLHRSGNIDEHRQWIAGADIVEIASEGATWLYGFLPSTPLQGELRIIMRKDPLFVELPPVKGANGAVYLFARKSAFVWSAAAG